MMAQMNLSGLAKHAVLKLICTVQGLCKLSKRSALSLRSPRQALEALSRLDNGC